MEALLANPEAFVLGGNAYFTLRSKVTGARYTYRVYQGKKAKLRGVEVYYVELMRGRDNNNDYAYFGWIKDNLFMHDKQRGRVTAEANSVVAFDWFWRYVILARSEKARAIIEVWHAGRCARCGRRLTVPESLTSGYGPECIGKV